MADKVTTQSQQPWRATVRTAFAVVVAIAVLADPILTAVADGGDPASLGGWAAGVLAVSGAITRVMALPQVEAFLARFLPWLAADPAASRKIGGGTAGTS